MKSFKFKAGRRLCVTSASASALTEIETESITKLMEIRNFEQIYAGRRVAVTGHTGFTGGWLCSWLNIIGADVFGYSLPPPTDPSLYDALGLKDRLSSTIGDIRDSEGVNAFFQARSPEIVFHLAAQPIVSAGYDDPRGTFETNVIGTLNVLEAARQCRSTRAVVCITTDKVYKNKEWEWGYREIDALGGTDPYSASKSAAEMVVQTYQAALAPRTNGVLIAAARGGNIIGGGDWAENRVVPDFVRAALAGKPLVLRNPSATRPWQHVMALAHAYLVLGHRLIGAAKVRWQMLGTLARLKKATDLSEISFSRCNLVGQMSGLSSAQRHSQSRIIYICPAKRRASASTGILLSISSVRWI